MDDAGRRPGILRVALAAGLPLLLVIATVAGLVLLIPTSTEFVFVQVGEDLVANPPDPPIDSYASPDSIVEATLLGDNAGNVAYGMLTTGGTICIAVRVLEESGLGSTSDCIPVEEFTERGIDLDRGRWNVRWTADGTVEWTRI